MKKRYNLTRIFIENSLEKIKETEENNDKTIKSTTETFYDMFTDDETDLKELLKKYAQPKINWINDSKINKAKRAANLIFGDSSIKSAKRMESDEEFIQELVKFELFEGYDDIKEKIINIFIEEYHKWKKDSLPNNLQEILETSWYSKQLENKLKREYEEEKKRIEKNMFEEICNEIETKYKDG
jgi:hypothetical protein